MEYTSKLVSIIYLMTVSMNGLEGCPATCSCTGTTVDCSNRGLTEVPSGIPTDTTILRLEENQLTYIGNYSFTGLSNLIELWLYSNRLEEMAAGAFSGLSQLSILNMLNNSIRALPETVFHGLDDLTYIHLKGNKLCCLHENLFSGLSNLDTLQLETNEITELPTHVFRGLGKLRILYLSYNLLSSLEENAFDEIGDRDLLGVHPKTVFHGLENLSHLYLHYNKLSYLHENIFSGLRNLDTLRLSGNELTELPARLFRGLGKLRVLHLTFNSLSSFEDNTIFHGLYNLSYLHLDFNKLSCLHENLFSGLSNLVRITLDYNDITELPASIFRGLHKLYDLYLHSNSLTILDENVFNGLNDLYGLYINENNLKALPENIFNGLNRLSRLDIFSNDITTLPGTIFEDLNNLHYLYLYNNPWSCDCRLRELRSWLDDNSYRLDFGSTAMTCESPDNHRSKSILDIPLANLTCYPIPVFYTPSKTIVAEIGDNVILDCEVESELEVDKYWMIPNGTVIHQSTEDMCSDYKIVQQGDGSLLIPFAEVDDEGSYSCVASNLEGTTLGVRVLKINRTHVTTETMSTASQKSVHTTFGPTSVVATDYTSMYTTVSVPPEMICHTNVIAGILAYFLGLITAGLGVVTFFALRYYRRAKSKRPDDNDSYENYNLGGDSSDTSADQIGHHVERSEATAKSARRANQSDRDMLPTRMSDKNKQVYANATVIEDAESGYTSISPDTFQKDIYDSLVE
ncbi:carboxypeptidase N subunit 2-like [Ptychodera flava]|uniref:carboxypeptidase N subunit 2-like n=1 Tax=Ptychodera flava TaxID=63121 RepID=UPI00396A66B0